MNSPSDTKPFDRVRLVHTSDQYTNLQPGAEGIVAFIDELLGTVHVNWEGGSSLGLVPGVDRWEVIS